MLFSVKPQARKCQPEVKNKKNRNRSKTPDSQLLAEPSSLTDFWETVSEGD